MRALILSCNTGEGHNSCAKAIKEVYDQNGVVCDIVDGLAFVSELASDFMQQPVKRTSIENTKGTKGNGSLLIFFFPPSAAARINPV